MKKAIKIELEQIAKGTKPQIKKGLERMKSESKISGFGMFRDGVNVYDHTGCVVFEINF